MEFTAKQIANAIDGRIEGDGNVTVNGFAKIEEGRPGTITFLANPKYTHYIYDTKASVVLVADGVQLARPVSATLIRVKDPYECIARLLQLYQAAQPKKTGVSPQACIAASASIGEGCYVGPLACVGEGVVIGPGSQIHPHAVIEDNVRFARLGFVVIDEQHRFGVVQRAKLWGKSDNPPHVLVMTATPIPRTLAMTLYGDLDVSVIDELPPGRKPVVTLHKYDDQTTSLYAGIRRQLNAGRQAYVVFPLIKESEKIDLKNLEEGYEALREAFPEFSLGKVHGRMKPAEKEEEMRRFVACETQILVATTVIEVGVNVPNASIMVILNAERFGLSQLHQLRGRVGRGADQSYCVLVSKRKLTDDTRKRLDIMCSTCDGFKIAEADLKLRGPGDLEGTQQSGMAFDLKIANIAKDGQIVQAARDEAQKIVDADPLCSRPEYAAVWQRLKALRKNLPYFGGIS